MKGRQDQSNYARPRFYNIHIYTLDIHVEWICKGARRLLFHGYPNEYVTNGSPKKRTKGRKFFFFLQIPAWDPPRRRLILHFLTLALISLLEKFFIHTRHRFYCLFIFSFFPWRRDLWKITTENIVNLREPGHSLFFKWMLLNFASDFISWCISSLVWIN